MLSDGEMSYLYDGFGRLEQVTKADGSFQKNHYNAEGLRAEMEENGQLVKFLYNENREAVAEEESDGNVIRYIRRLGLISSDSEKAKTYYHYVSDEQGSITHVINGEERMYSHVYSTTMNTMHSAIPSDVKNRCTTASAIRESSTIL